MEEIELITDVLDVSEAEAERILDNMETVGILSEEYEMDEFKLMVEKIHVERELDS
jgi:hypothetical protein